MSSGLTEVTIAPSALAAWKATTQSAEFGPSRPTASPLPIPCSASPAAVRVTRPASSAYVVTAPVAPSISAALSPRSAAPPITYAESDSGGISTSGYGLRRTVMRAAYGFTPRVAGASRRVERIGRRLARGVERAERLELHAEHEVADGDREVVVVLLAAVARPDGGVGDREEVGVVRVEEVGHPRPVPLARKLQGALDDVELGLEADAEAAEVHSPSIGHRARGL